MAPAVRIGRRERNHRERTRREHDVVEPSEARAERIVWASDYPHPDAKFPGVTEELVEALESLSFEQQQMIASTSAVALYGIE